MEKDTIILIDKLVEQIKEDFKPLTEGASNTIKWLEKYKDLNENLTL